jgi:hypothetical protein
MDGTAHRVVSTEVLNYHTGSTRLTCSCGWWGHHNRWSDLDHDGGNAPALPPQPKRPSIGREALRAAIYGERRSTYRSR